MSITAPLFPFSTADAARLSDLFLGEVIGINVVGGPEEGITMLELLYCGGRTVVLTPAGNDPLLIGEGGLARC